MEISDFDCNCLVFWCCQGIKGHVHLPCAYRVFALKHFLYIKSLLLVQKLSVTAYQVKLCPIWRCHVLSHQIYKLFWNLPIAAAPCKHSCQPYKCRIAIDLLLIQISDLVFVGTTLEVSHHRDSVWHSLPKLDDSRGILWPRLFSESKCLLV